MMLVNTRKLLKQNVPGLQLLMLNLQLAEFRYGVCKLNLLLSCTILESRLLIHSSGDVLTSKCVP